MAEGTVTEGWLHDTLEQLIAQIRALLDVTGVAFVTVDEERADDPPRRRLVHQRRRLARVHPAARPPVRPRARRRHRGGGRVGHGGADPADQRVARRRGPARPPVRAPRRPARAARVGLLRDRLVHLRAGAHRRRPHVRRAGDLLQPAAAPAQRGGPALGRGVRAARRAGARALRAARARGRAAARGGAAQPRAAGGRRLDRPRGRSTARSSSMRPSCPAPRACC